MRSVRAGGLLLTVLVSLAACQHAPAPDPQRLKGVPAPYAFPLVNPYAATVVGTPEDLKVSLPREIPIDALTLTPFEDRPIPDVFWYEDRFRYSLAAQPGEAPLVFIVAGTNAGPNNRYSRFLQKVFYVAGFHVASLSSPTFPNFMVTASSTGVPGRTSQDAADLYRAMQRIHAQIARRVPVTDVSLAGYSLGAWQSAFVADLDADQGALKLRKVLLINPPVSLYRSSVVLDRMVSDNLPGGIEGLNGFIDRVLARVTAVYQRSDQVDFSQDFLYGAYMALQPSPQELAALVGVAFRLASTNIAFTADVMSRWGYLVPADRRLTTGSSLTPYFDAGMRRGFEDYFENLLYPYYQAYDPGLTRQQMIDESSLERIGTFLAETDRVGLVTNADDIILAPGDIDFLRRTFSTRATIFPNGGHCGNLEHKQMVAAIVRFMTE
jgi:Alpha/beta hydrolase family